MRTSGKTSPEYDMSRQVFPQPPSPTTTSFFEYAGGPLGVVAPVERVARVFTVEAPESILTGVELLSVSGGLSLLIETKRKRTLWRRWMSFAWQVFLDPILIVRRSLCGWLQLCGRCVWILCVEGVEREW